MSKEIIVSKFGSSLVANRNVGLLSDQIDRYVELITKANPEAAHIFVVSGARETGLYKAEKVAVEKDLLTNEQLAGLGATAVFNSFELAFERVGIAASSYPVTYHLLAGAADPETLEERQSFMQVLLGNADAGIASVINEADAMNNKELMRLVMASQYEIDNDQLAAYIARVVGASTLTLWKKEGGLRDDDGLYIAEINDSNLGFYQHMLSHRSNGDAGRGGPATTLEAAALAARAGVVTRIAGVNANMTGVNVTTVMVG